MLLTRPLQQVLDEAPDAWRKVVQAVRHAHPTECDRLARAVDAQRGQVAPAEPLRALQGLRPEEVKVVILGQDPYPTLGHAEGLSFSCAAARPRSMIAVYKALARAKPGFVPPATADLSSWANQGVLLLNTVLTVKIGEAGSHLPVHTYGWQHFTSAIVVHLAQLPQPPLFWLWGGKAHQFFDAATQGLEGLEQVKVLRVRHPSYDDGSFITGAAQHLAEMRTDTGAPWMEIDWWRLPNPGLFKNIQ